MNRVILLALNANQTIFTYRSCSTTVRTCSEADVWYVLTLTSMWIPIDPSITWRCVDVSGSSGHSAGHPDHLAGLAGPAGPFDVAVSIFSRTHFAFAFSAFPLSHFFVWMPR